VLFLKIDISFSRSKARSSYFNDKNGIPVLVVSKILGHSKSSVTINIYVHDSVECNPKPLSKWKAWLHQSQFRLKKSKNKKFLDSLGAPTAPNCTGISTFQKKTVLYPHM